MLLLSTFFFAGSIVGRLSGRRPFPSASRLPDGLLFTIEIALLLAVLREFQDGKELQSCSSIRIRDVSCMSYEYKKKCEVFFLVLAAALRDGRC